MSLPKLNAKITLTNFEPITPPSVWKLTFNVFDLEGIFYATDIQVGDMICLDTSASYPETITRYRVTSIDPATTPSVGVMTVTFDDNMDPSSIDITAAQPDGLVCHPSTNNKFSYTADPSAQGLPTKFVTYLRNRDFEIVDSMAASGGNYSEIVRHTITPEDITAKQFLFSPSLLAPLNVMAFVSGGAACMPPNDFEITSGNTFNWNGKNLDNVISAGDVVVLVYANASGTPPEPFPINTYTQPKGVLTTADVGKFLMDDSGVAAVCSQTAPVPGQYNTWTIEFLGIPVVGAPTKFTVEILAIPTVNTDRLNFIGGAPYTPYGGSDWAEGATIEEVAANLATAWTNINPDDNGNFYIAVAVGSVVTFTAQQNRPSGSSTFQWVGNPAHASVTQTQVGIAASTFYFDNYSDAQFVVYGDNWTTALNLSDLAANFVTAWNLLSPAPIWWKLDQNAEPISDTPWVASSTGALVTLTQQAFGDPGYIGPTALNFPDNPTIINTVVGVDYVPPKSVKSFLGRLKAIDGASAVIEVLPFYSAIAKGAIDASGGDGNNNGRVSAVDGTHVEQSGQSPVYAGKAFFDVVDGGTVIFK